GLAATSAPVTVTIVPAQVTTTFMSAGAVWKYMDSGANLGTAWKEPGFDDSAWNAGPGELGYGDIPDGRPEATILNSGSPNNRIITHYFRHAFIASDASSIARLDFS